MDELVPKVLCLLKEKRPQLVDKESALAQIDAAQETLDKRQDKVSVAQPDQGLHLAL